MWCPHHSGLTSEQTSEDCSNKKGSNQRSIDPSIHPSENLRVVTYLCPPPALLVPARGQLLLEQSGVAEAQAGLASRAAAGRAAVLVGAEQQGADWRH